VGTARLVRVRQYGLARKVAGHWLAFFLPGFHPWNHDDRALINKADSEYAAAVMA
jgi:predicted metal-dependent hydrolase